VPGDVRLVGELRACGPEESILLEASKSFTNADWMLVLRAPWNTFPAALVTGIMEVSPCDGKEYACGSCLQADVARGGAPHQARESVCQTLVHQVS